MKWKYTKGPPTTSTSTTTAAPMIQRNGRLLGLGLRSSATGFLTSGGRRPALSLSKWTVRQL